jgi:hypothetical protein
VAGIDHHQGPARCARLGDADVGDGRRQRQAEAAPSRFTGDGKAQPLVLAAARKDEGGKQSENGRAEQQQEQD